MSLLLASAAAGRAEAACNLIPQAQPAFRGALGTVDRPFAAPGDFVEVNVRQGVCDGASPGFGSDPSQYEVTLLFTPGSKSATRALVLTSAPCASLATRLATCGATAGVAAAACVQLATPDDFFMAIPDGTPRLRFRFPDTDALLAPGGDRRTFTGPVKIVVTPAGSPLPCALVSGSCATQAHSFGAVACVDQLFAADGSCGARLDATFPSFTALPPPNDFQADCFTSSPPCTATATEIRLALDADGNLLIPFQWQGILLTGTSAPVPRTLRATVRPPVPFTIPDSRFLGSFTPEGKPLPPIFEPQSDPTVVNPDVITLFGTADAPSTVLRLAHRRGRCAGGSLDGGACVTDAHCPGAGACVDACAGGANDGLACTKKGDCPGGNCGAVYDAAIFAALAPSGGPVAVPRVMTPLPGACQLEPHGPCTSHADCAGAGNLCVVYGFQAKNPVALESLTQGTRDVLAFTASETLDLVDRNGDGVAGDTVVTVRDRTTGSVQPLGAPNGFAPGGAPLPGCGLTGTPEGRAIVQTPNPPFTVPAFASEDGVVAFVESENGEGYCDENGDGDRGDGVLRVFTVPGNERTAGVTPPRVVDPALVIEGKSLAVSNGRVFFRSSEAGMATHGMQRMNVGAGFPGAEANQGAVEGRFSKTGRFVVHLSSATNLVPGDTNGEPDVFVRDRQTGTVTRVNVNSAGTQSSGTFSLLVRASISADGRFVAFDTVNSDLVPGDTNVCDGGIGCPDIFVRDRDTDTDGIFDEPGATTTTRVSVGPGGVEADDRSFRPTISANGRFVVFDSAATNLVAGDTNGQTDIFVHDLMTHVTERVSVGSDGSENVGNQLNEVRESDISDDGRYVVFEIRTLNLPTGVLFGSPRSAPDVFVRDRLTGTTEQVTVDAGGNHLPIPGAHAPRISGDGRYVVYESFSTAFLNGDSVINIYDRLTHQTEVVSRDVDGNIPGPSFSRYPDVSDDGRFVVFQSDASTLLGPGKDTNGNYDVFLRDRLFGTTERLNLAPGGVESAGGIDGFNGPPAISPDGRDVMFNSLATDLLSSGSDTNGTSDIYLRSLATVDPLGIDALLFADGALDDTVLEVLDAASATVTTLCPATRVTVANGAAAFLRPESAAGTPACPGGSLNAADVDTTDEVVQLWPGAGPVQNLGRAATSVALSTSYVAALVSEAGQGAILNGDADTSDAVVQVHPVSGGSWTSTGFAGEGLAFCGPYVAFLVPEAAQGGAILNGDGDATDRVLHLYDPAADVLVNVGQAAEEFVCDDQVVAFRTSEVAQGNTDLQGGVGAPSPATFVLQTYDLTRPACVSASPPSDCRRNSQQAVRVCDFAACDPRTPYRVGGSTVKFLTFECEQRGPFFDDSCASGGTDLTGNFSPLDLVLQNFDTASGIATPVGAINPGGSSDPLQGSDTGTSSGTIYEATGQCVETFATSCSTTANCPESGAYCSADSCRRNHRTCVTSADCPAAVPCLTGAGGSIVPASPDTDGDGVPDHLDDCVDVPNADQADLDGDGAGDACDLATCNDGVRQHDEECETGDTAACVGACVACRCVECANVVADPAAKVEVKTTREAGQLKVTLVLPLASYTDEPIAFRLSDDDSPLIAMQPVGALTPKGIAPFKNWTFTTKAKTGVKSTKLKSLAPRRPGFKLTMQAKGWFTASAANLDIARTRVTVTVGTQCFVHAATRKTD